MNNFNKQVNNGRAHLYAFPGATPKQLNHYMLLALEEELPDSVIIHIGTNSLRNLKPDPTEISKDIMDIVKTCHSYGINNIYVSGLILRPAYQYKVDIINSYLKAIQDIYEYIYIDNHNVGEDQLWTDKIHMNNKGIFTLGQNFITHLNNKVIA